MATPAERKALLFFALVAVLGATVRFWRTHHADHHTSIAAEDSAGEEISPPGPPASRGGKAQPGGNRHTSRDAHASSHTRDGGSGRSRGSRTGQIVRDFGSTVDIDRAAMSEIDALGVLQPGVARMIVADRDSFGPFGSIQELARIPFLSTADLRKLAPRVTFSRLPRPRNTVIQPRSRDANVVVPRRTHRGTSSAQ